MEIQNFVTGPLRRLRIGRRGYLVAASVCALAVLCIAWTIFHFNAAPQAFPAGTVFSITQGDSIRNISERMKAGGFISSPYIFRKLVVVLGRQKAVIAGDYYFPEKISLFEMARRVTHGTFGMVQAKITVPEGFTAQDIANLFPAGKFYKFDRTEFLLLANGKEGYLFPDTYFFMPSVTAADVVGTLLDNFTVRAGMLRADFASSTRSESDIIKVASIIEEEAASSTDRQIISGIIWHRLKIGMPLQVDATLGYVMNKGTFQLTASDLNFDSPYNTYVYKGLPPTPISNPGLDAISAALHPTTTPYLYYLSDKSGTIHYAKTFDEHKRNRDLYLNK